MRPSSSICCALLILASPAAGAQRVLEPVPQADIDRAIDDGVEALRSAQLPDGSWPYQGTTRRPGCTALVLYALLASAVEPDDPAVVRGLRHLAHADVSATYDAALVAMALQARDPGEHRDWITEVSEQLRGWQEEVGDWGYPGAPDLSNTQFAALGLRAAALAGVEVPPAAWSDLGEAVLRYGNSRGGFSYRRREGVVTPSMTAAGVGTLAICDAWLARAGAQPADRATRWREVVERGADRLGQLFPRMLNTTGSAWPFYALYGVERVGALLGMTRLGDHDWYPEGAAALVRDQRADGFWGKGEALPETAFALLFLRRATALPTTGAAAPSQRLAARTGDVLADVQIAVAENDPTVFWIHDWGPRARERHEWPGQRGRGPHVERVVWLVNGREVGDVPGDATRAVEAERFPLRHRFETAGTWRVRARVHVVGPPPEGATGLAGERVEVLSPELEVEVRGVVPRWVLAQREDRERNLLAGVGANVRASSRLGARASPFGVEHEPRLASDRRARTAWIADRGDDTPRLTLTLDRRVRADRVLVSHARSVPLEAGSFGRAVEVEVLLDGQPAGTIRMPPEEQHKGVLELEQPRRIGRVELRLTWVAPGARLAPAGIAEVELQLGATRGR
jgi:hypothetical protein